MMNRFIYTALLILLYMASASEQLPMLGKGSLYGPEDFVYSLNGTSMKSEIFHSNRAWVVEFYSSWCGHCVNFAPKWKQFGIDLKEWRSLVSISGLDCADENNIPTCREFEIMGYPTIKLFPPNAPQTVTDIDGKETLNTGTHMSRPESMGKLKTNLIDSLIPMYPKLLGSMNTSSLHMKEPDHFWRSAEFSDGPPFLLFVYESNGSYVGLETALRLSRYQKHVRVLRYHRKTPMYDRLGFTGWPAAGYISRDQASGSIILSKNQDLVDLLVKATIGLAQIAPLVKEVPEQSLAVDLGDAADLKLLDSSRDSVSTEDLFHTVRNILRNEVGLPAKLSGSKIGALKNFLAILSKYFPTDRREVQTFLANLSEWIRPQHEVENTAYLDKLSELESELNPWDIDIHTWYDCRGTVPGRRGYTCGLWRLFHTLTAMGLKNQEDSQILPAIYGYIKEFFGCQECSDHFTKMVEIDNALEILPIKEQTLWLWKAHNEVNLRLQGTPSEDPAFPKALYPSQQQCAGCYLTSQDFDMVKVEEYLLKIYTHPKRHVGSEKFDAGDSDASISDNSKSSNSGWLGFFSLTDIGIFMIVYFSIALLLVFAYIHFKVASRRRRLIDPIRRLFTSSARKESLLPLQTSRDSLQLQSTMEFQIERPVWCWLN